MKVLRSSEIKHREMCSLHTGEKFGLSAILSDSVDCEDLFLRHELLPAGSRSSSPHSHAEVDEVVFVLEGTLRAHEGKGSQVLEAGDCLCFRAGDPELHFLSNEGPKQAVYLVMSRKIPGNDTRY